MAVKGKFTSETAPKGKGRAKSIPNQVKDAIGLTNWKGLKEWAEGPGISKCIEEIETLKGDKYVYAYATILEYIKPKLQRTTLGVDPDAPLIPKVLKVEVVQAKPVDD